MKKTNTSKRKLGENKLSLVLILFAVILLTLGSSNIYKNNLENKINNSYLSKVISNVQYNEIKSASLEFSADTFLYISYTGESKIHSLEVKMKKILKDYELIDNTIYMNINDLMSQTDYLAKLNKTLNIEENPIEKVPAIIYYKDNKIVEVIDSRHGILDSSKFLTLLDKYEITK